MSGPGLVAGLSAGKGPATDDTKTETPLVRLKVVIPRDVIREDFDVDEARVLIEELAEELLKKITDVDDSHMCESAATTIYQTTTAWAERVDFCLGRLDSRQHIHGYEEYGGNLNEVWWAVEIFVQQVEEDDEDEEDDEEGVEG
jgi:hypothetical protein